MRETRRVLKLLRDRLAEITGQVSGLEEERQRLVVAIEVVEETEEEAKRPGRDRGEVRRQVLAWLEEHGPASRGAVIAGTGATRGAVGGALKRLAEAGAIVREERRYRVAQPPLPTRGEEPDEPEESVQRAVAAAVSGEHWLAAQRRPEEVDRRRAAGKRETGRDAPGIPRRETGPEREARATAG